MFSFIKGLFSKKEDEDNNYDFVDLSTITKPKDISGTVDNFTYDMIEDPIIEGNKDSKLVFLLMDDQPQVFFLYDTDFKNINIKYDIDILDKFKIVKCVGENAGFIAHKYLSNNTDNLVIALLDITLGKIIKTRKEVEVQTTTEYEYELLTFDGVDIALEIFNKYPKCDVKFCTSHRLYDDNTELFEFTEKFNNKTGLEISDFYFNKNCDRVTEIMKLLDSVLDYEEYKKYTK